MRALRYHGIKDLRLDQDVPEPKCSDTQVKIRRETHAPELEISVSDTNSIPVQRHSAGYVGQTVSPMPYCQRLDGALSATSDLRLMIGWATVHEYSSPTFIPSKESPHPVTRESMPVAIGHEFSGTIVEIGPNAVNPQNLQIGDDVAVQPTICCFGCGPCQEGYINCCDSAGFVGLSGGGGGMTDAVCVDPQFVFKLPKGISLEVGALVEPLAVAWHAVDQYPIKEGDEALVLGAGPIGLGVIQCLKARGAKTIIAAEVAAQRQKFAKEFGATHVVDPSREDVVKRAKEICGGLGPHLALDAAGVAASVKSAALAVRARGTVVNVAIWEEEVSATCAFEDAKSDDEHGRFPSNQIIWCLGRRNILLVRRSPRTILE